jgi:ABC-type glutathione transport system ATPase component
MSLIQVENLTKVYGTGETSVTALDHVNLEVNAGEFVAVMGPSGRGPARRDRGGRGQHHALCGGHRQ